MEMLPEVKTAYNQIKNEHKETWPNGMNPCGHAVYAWQLRIGAINSIVHDIENTPVGAGTCGAVRHLIAKLEEAEDYGIEYNVLCDLLDKIEGNRLQS